MKTPPCTPEFRKFTDAMRDILKVSKGEMQTRMEVHKESGKRLSKGSASLGSAASAKDPFFSLSALELRRRHLAGRSWFGRRARCVSRGQDGRPDRPSDGHRHDDIDDRTFA